VKRFDISVHAGRLALRFHTTFNAVATLQIMRRILQMRSTLWPRHAVPLA
jgi:hypothetical protein